MSTVYNLKNKWMAELVFWAITIVLLFAIVYPVYQFYGDKFPYIIFNASAVLIFLLFTRYIFLLRFAPHSHNPWIKLVLLFSCIPIFLYLLNGLWDFQNFLDIGMLENIARADASFAKNESMNKYTTYEFIFFSTGALITTVIMPVRMVISIFRVMNKKDKV